MFLCKTCLIIYMFCCAWLLILTLHIACVNSDIGVGPDSRQLPSFILRNPMLIRPLLLLVYMSSLLNFCIPRRSFHHTVHHFNSFEVIKAKDMVDIVTKYCISGYYCSANSSERDAMKAGTICWWTT